MNAKDSNIIQQHVTFTAGECAGIIKERAYRLGLPATALTALVADLLRGEANGPGMGPVDSVSDMRPEAAVRLKRIPAVAVVERTHGGPFEDAVGENQDGAVRLDPQGRRVRRIPEECPFCKAEGIETIRDKRGMPKHVFHAHSSDYDRYMEARRNGKPVQIGKKRGRPKIHP